MKRKASVFLCLFLCAALLFGCDSVQSTNNTTAPESSGAAVDSAGAVDTEKALKESNMLGTSPDDNYRVWYEIFVYSYCDSDGNGIGDINGVRSKLPELKALGITGIWLMPIHPSTTYHKYNVSDYYDIDPSYGSMEDFDAFIRDCSKLGIKVIMDLVVNHTGNEHLWFKNAASYLKSLNNGDKPLASDCKYIDYYNFGLKEEIKGGSTNISGTDYYYESQFSADMPDLNLDNAEVRSEIVSIMKFWLSKGVAGFRLDAAKEFYSGQADKNIEFLSWLKEEAESILPDCYLVAEIWDTFATISSYYQSGICSIFNYPFGNSDGKIIKVLRGAGQSSVISSYATALEKADKAYASNNSQYIDAPFLSNHDVGRIAGFVGRDPLKTKLAGAMNLFMSGSCFVYYGEEIGMIGSGNDPSKRAPMYWNSERNDGTTNAPPDCEIPKEYPFGSLEEQRNDDTSIYNYYRQAIAIRNALPVISHGRITAETLLNIGNISAQRKTWNDDSCIILFNISADNTEVDLRDYTDWKLVAQLSADGTPVTMIDSKLNMPAYGTAILIPR